MIEILSLDVSGVVSGARVARPSRTSAGTLAFVHGVGSMGAIWDAQLEAFGNDYLCAAIELRGNGALHPDPDPALISRAGFAADVRSVLDALGSQSCTLIGCSLGGVVAFELWQHTPQRIEAMLILGSFARYPDGAKYAAGIARAVEEAGSMPVFARKRAAMLDMPPRRLDETIEQMSSKSVACYLAATDATWTGDYRAVLPGIDVPALVAYGEHDAIAPRGLSEEIASGIPGAQLHAVPAAGHVANADNPVAFNALLREFLTART
jgi:pimeloyl-ACP methyl ester carboxylesterase